ncbi:hypothetical protein DFH09DRAFT_1330113 [Mycena vulgaris]|nr:hypothetical protein DFH09DRAFT_1330113 [Mycena vulgaris]
MPDSPSKRKTRGASAKEAPATRETRSRKSEKTVKAKGGRRAPSPIPDPPTGTRGRKARQPSPVPDPPKAAQGKKAVPRMTSTPHKKVEAALRDEEEDEQDEDEDEGGDGGKEVGEDDVVIRYQSPSSNPDDDDDEGEGDNKGKDGKDEDEEDEEKDEDEEDEEKDEDDEDDEGPDPDAAPVLTPGLEHDELLTSFLQEMEGLPVGPLTPDVNPNPCPTPPADPVPPVESNARPTPPADPNVPSVDPNARPTPPADPNVPPVDPNARPTPPADPNVPPVDPNARPTPPADPNTPPVDPNARSTPPANPNTPPVDPNAHPTPPADPNTPPANPPVDPNTRSTPPADPNAPPVNPNTRKTPPADSNVPPVDHLEEKESDKEEEESSEESDKESDKGATKPSVRQPEEGLRNLTTHQERHPDDPTQPGKSKKSKTKKGSAEKSTAGLKQKGLKQARAGLAEAVAALHLLVEEKAEALAAEYHLSLDEVKDVVRSATKFKKTRGYHEFNAKVWQRGVELNADKEPGQSLDIHQLQDIVRAEPEGTWSPEQLAQLKADYTAHKLSKKAGTRASNAEAAKDATFIGDRFFEELILLEKRTGARGFAVIAGSNVNDTIIPTMTPATFALKFNKWACFREEVDADKMGHTELKGTVAKLLQEDLCHVSGNDSIKIDYKNYEEIMQAFYGYEIVGWPDNVSIAAPSNLGRGGSAALKVLFERLKSNTCFWRAVDGDRRKELQTKWEKQGGKKGKGKKKAAKQDEEEEEEEPQTKKSKGKRRQREAESEEEEEAPARRKTKKMAGEKRKRSKTVASEEEEAEAEETEPEPEPAKKASKKAKGGAKAVETVEGEPPKKKKKTAVETVEEEPPKKKKTAVETVEEEPPKKKKKDEVESVGGTAPKKTQKKKAVEVEEEDDAPASKSKGKRKQREDDEENAPRKKAAFSKRRKAPAPGRSASVVPSDTGSEPEGSDSPNTPDANTSNDTPDGAARLMAIKAKKAAAQKEADEAKACMSAANPRKTSKSAVAGPSKLLKLAVINDDDEYESSDSDDTD